MESNLNETSSQPHLEMKDIPRRGGPGDTPIAAGAVRATVTPPGMPRNNVSQEDPEREILNRVNL
ncbi:hypothetical protein F8E02_11160 [Methanoculleus sp. Wushi-C6]|uniref:Uncharacterized protein n=1 Tax=Methanoculleus caldifontis TaxID=2651577 RepID=A0ABU3X3B4_9EURY|nr:hypothetical protein [Methanoculleus sp. Wushi-C6]